MEMLLTHKIHLSHSTDTTAHHVRTVPMDDLDPRDGQQRYDAPRFLLTGTMGAIAEQGTIPPSRRRDEPTDQPPCPAESETASKSRYTSGTCAAESSTPYICTTTLGYSAAFAATSAIPTPDAPMLPEPWRPL